MSDGPFTPSERFGGIVLIGLLMAALGALAIWGINSEVELRKKCEAACAPLPGAVIRMHCLCGAREVTP